VGDPASLRAEFPVLERFSYLNAGTNGPVPRRALQAAQAALARQVEGGRGGHEFFMWLVGQMDELRARVAGVVGCDSAELALLRSTTDGVNVVLAALDLGEGDEVLTTDEEHPGVLAPLAGMRERRGIRIRVVPFESVAEEVRPETRLVACSHVSWVTGRVVDASALEATGAPVLLDGAQGLGAVPVDVRALGCDFYAAAGQKWLCGPAGTGYLYVRAERVGELPAPWPGFGSVKDAHRPLDFDLQDSARRFDTALTPPEHTAWALASLNVLGEPGIDAVLHRAAALAAHLADVLVERGATVAPRGHTTLVSWESANPEAEVERLREQGIVVRNLPGRPYIRASVGAWNEEAELDRLAALAP
jgi:selenocysteine lyase/cysteine desulfurase